MRIDIHKQEDELCGRWVSFQHELRFQYLF